MDRLVYTKIRQIGSLRDKSTQRVANRTNNQFIYKHQRPIISITKSLRMVLN